MRTIKANNREEAKARSLAEPGAIVVDVETGNLWTGPVTLRPVQGSKTEFLVYGDQCLDALGAVERMASSGLWIARRYGGDIALKATMRDAAIALHAAS